MRKLLLFLTLMLSASAGAQTFGKYYGYLDNQLSQTQQLATLDFIIDRTSPSEMHLMGVLKLYLGDFNSTEYVSYVFPSISYNILTGLLIFDNPAVNATIIVSHFQPGQFEGAFRETSAGNIGTLRLTQNPTVNLTNPLVQPLWGEYRGICDGFSSRLQVQTFRNFASGDIHSNAFAPFQVAAQFAEDDPEACGEFGSSCVKQVYNTGYYDFFTGRLQLVGRANARACSVRGNVLDCDGCNLTRISSEGVSGSSFTYTASASPWTIGGGSGPVFNGGQLSGVYRGYVHHERLDQYQPLDMNILAYPFQTANGSELRMSVTAKLLFGDYTSAEFIPVRFEESAFPIISTQLVFQRVADGVDPIAQIVSLSDEKIEGIWYSRIFGRVGTFVAKKYEAVDLPSNAVIFDKLAGTYESENWRLRLQVNPVGSLAPEHNPFYPLSLAGTSYFLGMGPAHLITSASYDYYTGKLGIQVDDESLFAGMRLDNSLCLKRPTPGVIRPLVPHACVRYERTSN